MKTVQVENKMNVYFNKVMPEIIVDCLSLIKAAIEHANLFQKFGYKPCRICHMLIKRHSIL